MFLRKGNFFLKFYINMLNIKDVFEKSSCAAFMSYVRLLLQKSFIHSGACERIVHNTRQLVFLVIIQCSEVCIYIHIAE